jgi:hypothetical protein
MTDAMKFSPEEQQKLEAVYTDIEKLEKEAGFHPVLAKAIAMCCRDDGKPWIDKLSPEAEQALVKELADAHAKGTVRNACFDLLRLSTWLDHDQKAGMPAYQLLNIVNNAVIEYQLAPSRGPDAKFAGVEAEAEKKRQALGQRDKELPAKVGEKAPDGSVTIDKIVPRRRI